MISIGSNLASRKLVVALSKTTQSLSQTYERLSSGMRLNRAADDPAGLAVSSLLDVKSRTFSRALLNVNDGASLLNIADASLGQISLLLTRMGELANQAANGVLSTSQRLNLNKEYSQLDREIRRIASTTKFNGLSLVEGQKTTSQGRAITSVAGSLGVLSTDGRYQGYGTGGNTMTIRDSVTGAETVVTDVGGAITTAMGFLQNGDMVFTSKIGGVSNDVRVYRKSTGLIETLTNSLSTADGNTAVLSADGTTIAFTSTTQYTIGGTKASAVPGASQRVYALNINSGIISGSNQIVSSVNEIEISADGAKLALYGNGVNALMNPTSDIYTLDLTPGGSTWARATTGTVNGNTTLAGISMDGTVYASSLRNFSGTGLGTNQQIWSISQDGSQVQQLTNNTFSNSPSAVTLSADGSLISFISSANHTGENPSSVRQAFRFDLSTGEMRQMTNYSGAFLTAAPVFSGDGLQLLNPSGTLNLIDLSPTPSDFNIEVGLGTQGGISSLIDSILGAVKGLGAYVLTTSDMAAGALDRIKSNIDLVGIARGKIGASMSRLDSAGRLLDSQSEEAKAASGRIRDVDVATEAAELARLQILQNVSAAILSQANNQPRLALQLLGSQE